MIISTIWGAAMNAVQIRKELRLLIREMGLLSHNCFNSGMTLAQAHVLSYLKQNDVTPFRELLLQLGMEKASLSRLLNTLSQKQYIMADQDNIDKRAKNIRILPAGLQAINRADTEATTYINDILGPCDQHRASGLTESLKTLRLLVLRNNIAKNPERVKIEVLPAIYYNDAIQFAAAVFCREQNIPLELVPIYDAYRPVWWCVRAGEDILGTAASWLENGEWHWGRFAVDTKLRGLGLGKALMLCSLQETFAFGADKVFLEARDVTVALIRKVGGKVTGGAQDFYGQPVTPMVLYKADFLENQHIAESGV